MLRSLTIRDFVIVDRLDLEFGGGFTVLTGETGAGKSILIDALSLLLGERSDAGLVRQGCTRAELAAEFTLDDATGAVQWLADNDLTEDPGQCLLRRVMEAAGRSRAYINGRPVTLQQLKELGAMLVDIHGQHEHQSLLRPAVQRELLDSFADCLSLAAEVSAAWRHWQDVRRRRLAWEQDAHALEAERERLRWQRQELERLGFSAEEWETLQADHRRLTNAANLRDSVEATLESLSEGDGAVLAVLDGAIQRLNNVVEFDKGLAEMLEVLEPARIQVQEAVYGLRHYRDRVDLDPQRLREIEQRLDAVHTTARKYRITPSQLPELLADTRRRLEELGEAGNVEALTRAEGEAQQAYREKAQQLSAQRQRAAEALARQVSEQMQGLAMTGGRFEVQLVPVTEGNAQGLEQIEFLVAANPGASPRSLSKVASGGELSRISLAIQTVTSSISQVPTLVFDEVDAGIGGRVAEIVGRMLQKLGRKHQVMCITHLPQVAAAADQQWQVSKTASTDGARTQVRVLDSRQRVEEIARMLGGVKITETTRKHAAEMLGVKGSV
ncbi:MAG TPA: DNA repair protein RecN [Burkholderiales bacterium]|nr:DNA repair protein RecN [Burkholderiales bacterium]